MSECMNSSTSVEVQVSRTCGKPDCKNKGLQLRPKSLDLDHELKRTNSSSSSGDEWAEDSVTSADL
ncbi:hypothetical protein Q9L58_008080 [Maublancomyces gigas]|uniref:Uncharacterized protein n=1 Tax=Discina gigas TaxID=1032678 RepID=A0ABR3GAX6_9PEZI